MEGADPPLQRRFHSRESKKQSGSGLRKLIESISRADPEESRELEREEGGCGREIGVDEKELSEETP